MRFATDSELTLFADSVAAALEGFEAPLEPPFGTCWDEHDEGLAERLRAVGWTELWELEDHRGAVVAGAIELGRRVAPLALVDEATLGGSLVIGDRVRHGRSVGAVVGLDEAGLWTVDLCELVGGRPEASLDGTGTRVGVVRSGARAVTGERGGLWVAATLGYAAGLARSALDAALAHVSAREQFGAPLAALPVVQNRLVDAAVLADGLELVAWEAVWADPSTQQACLAWSGPAVCGVVTQAMQVHGALAFALEGGLHRQHRRARTVQAWNDALLAGLQR